VVSDTDNLEALMRGDRLLWTGPLRIGKLATQIWVWNWSSNLSVQNGIWGLHPGVWGCNIEVTDVRSLCCKTDVAPAMVFTAVLARQLGLACFGEFLGGPTKVDFTKDDAASNEAFGWLWAESVLGSLQGYRLPLSGFWSVFTPGGRVSDIDFGSFDRVRDFCLDQCQARNAIRNLDPANAEFVDRISDWVYELLT
jgi:hypothetical protein